VGGKKKKKGPRAEGEGNEEVPEEQNNGPRPGSDTGEGSCTRRPWQGKGRSAMEKKGRVAKERAGAKIARAGKGGRTERKKGTVGSEKPGCGRRKRRVSSMV